MPQGDRAVSEAIKQYLEAVEKATDFRHGDSLERFLIAEADMHRVARAAMDAADEVRELVMWVKDFRNHRHARGCQMAAGQDELIAEDVDPGHAFSGEGEECALCQGVPEDHVCTCGLDRIRELVR